MGHDIRSAVGCSDWGHTAVSQLKVGDIDCVGWSIYVMQEFGAEMLAMETSSSTWP